MGVLVEGVSSFLWPIFTYCTTASKADLKLWEPVSKKYLPSSSQIYQYPFSEHLHLPSIRTHSNSPVEESNCSPWRKVPHLSQESRRQTQNYFFYCWNGKHPPMLKQRQIVQNRAKKDQTLRQQTTIFATISVLILLMYKFVIVICYGTGNYLSLVLIPALFMWQSHEKHKFQVCWNSVSYSQDFITKMACMMLEL